MKFIAPKRMPEANVQAELYRQLRNKGLRCCLEYKMKTPKGENVRVDCIIFDENNFIVLLVETKSSKRPDKRVNTGTRQFERYKDLGLPFTYCINTKDAEPIVEAVHRGLIPQGEKFIKDIRQLL